MSAVMANVRDASFLGWPRHDGVGGHRPGAWAPKYHIIRDHPVKGDYWSACGTVFLSNEYSQRAEDVPARLRCKRRGCRELWP